MKKILLFAVFLFCAGCGIKPELTSYPMMDGDFSLQSMNGEKFALSSQAGKVVLLFFGYTTCPDICPMTLARIKSAYELIGEDASKKIQTVFVTLDPERDTPAKLTSYLAHYDIGAIGLTGKDVDIKKVVSQYKGYFEKVADSNSELKYLINHTDYIYLIDQKGQVRYLFRREHNAEFIRDAVKQLL